MKYIPLDAVLAEIKRRYKLVDKYETNEFCAVASRYELVHIKNFINTLEVKEVDLDMEINLYVRNLHRVPNFEELNKFAKHFFELGMAVSNKDKK